MAAAVVTMATLIAQTRAEPVCCSAEAGQLVADLTSIPEPEQSAPSAKAPTYPRRSVGFAQGYEIVSKHAAQSPQTSIQVVA